MDRHEEYRPPEPVRDESLGALGWGMIVVAALGAVAILVPSQMKAQGATRSARIRSEERRKAIQEAINDEQHNVPKTNPAVD